MSNDNKAVAVYNATERKLIAVFRTARHADKYVFDAHKNATVASYVQSKARSHPKNNNLGVILALRKASEEQVALMGNTYYWIEKEYFSLQLFKFVKAYNNKFEGTRGLVHEASKTAGSIFSVKQERLSPSEILELQKSFKDGVSIRNLSLQYSISATLVSSHCKDLVLERTLSKFSTEQLQQEINRRNSQN